MAIAVSTRPAFPQVTVVEMAGMEPVGNLVEPLVEARDPRWCERVLMGTVGRSAGFVDGLNGRERIWNRDSLPPPSAQANRVRWD